MAACQKTKDKRKDKQTEDEQLIIVALLLE